MDDLVHHCLRELSFDGDLGCDIARLRDFIVGYHTVDATRPQTVDVAFCAFVWSIIAQQPAVRVGTVPAGVSTEVYIAPQMSAKRKAHAKGEEVAPDIAPSLDIIPEALNRTFEDLQAEFGTGLRIAVDHATSFAALIGSHLRPSKLSPMVYSALQLVTRGREKGISVLELGRKSKYDQKTCFYLVKQLIELDLVVKKKKPGIGANFVIHKYFYDRDVSWQQISNEEALAGEASEFDDTPDTMDIQGTESKVDLSFEPIDSRHLSSLNLVRGRVVKLLKASRNRIHASNNMLVAIGFVNPIKVDRRFFQTRIRELIAEGLIERVAIPGKQRVGATAVPYVKCFRLIGADAGDTAEDVMLFPQATLDGSPDAEMEEFIVAENGVKMSVTLHKQIAEILEDAGTRGMTLNELSSSLGYFDKRTLELFLTREEKNQPPAHLCDLGTADIMETYGRERRHRYYTVAALRTLAVREGLDGVENSYSQIILSAVGDFRFVQQADFYETDADLIQYIDHFKTKTNPRANSKLKNPIMSDGSVKLGRPRKNPSVDVRKGKGKLSAGKPLEKAAGSLAGKRKREVIDEGYDDSSKSRKTTQSKKPRISPHGEDLTTTRTETKNSTIPVKQFQVNVDAEAVIPQKRKRTARGSSPGASVTLVSPDSGDALLLADIVDSTFVNMPSKKRGRPPKKPHLPEDIHVSVTSTPARATRQESIPPPPGSPIKGGRPKDTSSQALAKHPTLPEDPNVQRQDRLAVTPSPTRSPETEVRQSNRKRRPVNRQDMVATTKTKFAVVQAPRMAEQAGASAASGPMMSSSSSKSGNELYFRELSVAGGNATDIETAAPENAMPIVEEESYAETRAEDLLLCPTQALKANSRSKINVSALRRENEICRVIEGFGGLVNFLTKEFTEAHTNLIEELNRAGEPTSAPSGTRLDKRTAEATLNSMFTRGKVKILKTSLITPTGMTRPACVVYMPETTDDMLNAFLSDMGRNYSISYTAPFNRVDTRLSYSSARVLHRAALPLQLLQMEEPGEDNEERWSRNASRADQLFSYDDATVREVLLTERTTVGQLYGLIVGKAMRVRQLHLIILDYFDRHRPSPHIISHENRIVDLAFFHQDISVSAFCSVAGCLIHDEELLRLLKTEGGAATPVHALPVKIRSALQVGKARTKTRVLDILDILRSLGLATPMQASEVDCAQVVCEPSSNYPTAFVATPLDAWSTKSSVTAPNYWYFNDRAPIHLWTQSEISPPFWKEVATSTYQEAIAYWHDLDEACRNKDLAALPGLAVGDEGPPNAGVGVGRTLRRAVSWNGAYTLTWHQEQYLHRFVDMPTGVTPLQDEETGEAQLQKMCWVVSAPREAVEAYFMKARDKYIHNRNRMRHKRKHDNKEEVAKRALEAKELLKRKATESKLQKEKGWDELLVRVHPEPLTGSAAVRVRRVRSCFLHSSTGRDQQKWEDEVTQAIRDVALAKKSSTKKESLVKRPIFPNPRLFASHIVPPMRSGHIERSVQEIVFQQGPAFPETERRKRRKKDLVEKEILENHVSRRGRFQWNREYDELARDASAIIKARASNGARLEWSALEQIFPAVPKNSARQRIATLREVPGAKAYLTRLQDAWYQLWYTHKGSQELSDDHPESLSTFDLVEHIEFLRKHIDKNAIRVGFASEESRVNLPGSVAWIDKDWEVTEKVVDGPLWEFLWNANVEEGREKRLLGQSLSAKPSETPPGAGDTSENVCLAEAVVKMVFGTPIDTYDPQSAATLLHRIGEEDTLIATSSLLAKNILAKSMRKPSQSKPGRTLKVSDMNQNALGGSITHNTFQDAAGLEDTVTQDVWCQWPLVATDGDIAALVQFVSEDKVQFGIDTTPAQAARPGLDWNSKKAGESWPSASRSPFNTLTADDDQIETTLSVCFTNSFEQAPELQSAEGSPNTACVDLIDEPNMHGISDQGEPACCKQRSGGLIDCSACIKASLSTFVASADPGDVELIRSIWVNVSQNDAKGVSKSGLLVATKGLMEHVMTLVNQMVNLAVPLLFWTGYSSLVLVSSAHLNAWTILVSADPPRRVFPRRWLDLSGKEMSDVWGAALRAVVGVVFYRPGVSQAELRWRLRSVYDRQEVQDVLQYLLEAGHIKRRWNPRMDADAGDSNEVAVADEEEENTFWFVSDEQSKHWYQV